MSEENQEACCLSTCRALTDSIYTELDLKHEIIAVDTHNLGEPILLWHRNGDDLLERQQQQQIGERKLLGLTCITMEWV